MHNQPHYRQVAAKISRVVLALIFAAAAAGCYPQSSVPMVSQALRTTLSTGLQSANAGLSQSFGALPLYFVENGGQVDDQVAFILQGRDQTIYFTPQGITFALDKASSQQPEQRSSLVSRRAGDRLTSAFANSQTLASLVAASS